MNALAEKAYACVFGMIQHRSRFGLMRIAYNYKTTKLVIRELNAFAASKQVQIASTDYCPCPALR